MKLHLLDELPQDLDSRYRLVHAAAKRSRQINRGVLPLVDTKALKPTTIALEEIAASKVKLEVPFEIDEAKQPEEAGEESRAAWFRHIPPEELISEQLVSEGEKEAGAEFELDADLEEFQPELEQEGKVLEEGMEEYDPISEVALNEKLGGVEIEGGKVEGE